MDTEAEVWFYGGMARNDRVIVVDHDGHYAGTISYQDWWDAGGPQWWREGE